MKNTGILYQLGQNKMVKKLKAKTQLKGIHNMVKKSKLIPMPEQINNAKAAWNTVKYDIYEQDEPIAENIQTAFNNKDWDKVFTLCCEIGCEDVAYCLYDGKSL